MIENKIPKEVRQQVLADLNKKYGGVQPSRLVDVSRPKNAPLHDAFEWDDKKAAEEHRLSQARRIIRITTIKKADGNGEQRFVNVPVLTPQQPTAVELPSREGFYKPVDVVVKIDDEYYRALRQLRQQLYAIESQIMDLKRARGEEEPKLSILVDMACSMKGLVSSILS